MTKTFKIIVATDSKRGIARVCKIPWNVPQEMKHFKDTTVGPSDNSYNVVIMGRNTWESLPRRYAPLPYRLNVVLSKTCNVIDGAEVFRSLDDALDQLSEYIYAKDVFVIGGEEVYKEAIKHPLCTEVIQSVIPGDFKCDKFFPLVPSTFKKVDVQGPLEGNFSIYKYTR
jgi:dihydrofolate reductase